MSKFTPAEIISRNHAAACSAVVTLRQTIASEAANGREAERIAASVTSLAHAEGARDFWYRLEQVATYAAKQGEEFTELKAMQVSLSFVAKGADDTWSGRGNDVKRSYFDGLRSAADKVEDIFN